MKVVRKQANVSAERMRPISENWKQEKGEQVANVQGERGERGSRRKSERLASRVKSKQNENAKVAGNRITKPQEPWTNGIGAEGWTFEEDEG